MKFVCDKNNLLDAINIVSRAVSQKSTVPILEGILIESENDKIVFTGNDYEIGIRYICDAQVIEEGKTVLNAKMFGDIVRKLPDAPVVITSDEKNTSNIKCANVSFDIMGYSDVEYPRIPEITRDFSYNITENKLKGVIKDIIYAVPQTSTRPVLTGALFEVKNNLLTVVSSDRFRIALRRETIDETGKNFSSVIPGKTLNEILKILKDEENYLRMYFSEKHVLFEFDNFTVTSRLRDGEYINYKGAIPTEYNITCKCNAADFASAVDRASLIINNEVIKSSLKLNIDFNRIELSCSSAVGKINDSVSVESDGENFSIAFNYKYLLDALKNSDAEEVYIKFISAGSPAVIEPVEGDSFMHLILPIK